MGLVKRCQRAKVFELADEGGIDQPGRGELCAAVDDPVPDRDDLPVFERMVGGPGEKLRQKVGVAERGAIWPLPFEQRCAIDRPRPDAWRNADLIDLASGRKHELPLRIEGKQREFDA